METVRPLRQIRAAHDDDTLTVYQAYPPAIADAALAAGTFVAPFKRERMTWIKPSFRWMMYRSGWAAKPDQERVLAVRIRRGGFAWALAHACLSHYDRDLHASAAAWKEQLRVSPVRIQWDPERSTNQQELPHRAVQIGLTGEAVHRYVDEWIVSLTDVTDLAHETHALVRASETAKADALIPAETPYPLPELLRARIGADEG
ncbi:DUF4291 domain-containing protein [Streptacidiphilus fuscans]|uniref:DUF4291 domain-containing protein n=1 Tax=Streptacidiphilus fuscans TaxID=2789292 RepID=A0A931BCX1_9ACTN|nr:DUF4291 domain-containing protein [Streptacidiphilus fuscans]MBF9073261.1 DUF4291 domain-containing protein [Streptacidiphilus fuscans]